MNHKKNVSLICTVKNEAGTIAALLDALERQTVQPDEIIIVDGGSTDRTASIIKNHSLFKTGLRMIEHPGNIAVGRNEAIRQASREIVVSVDAGVTMPEQWLVQLMRPFEKESAIIVWGPTVAMPQSLFELALASVSLPTRDEAGIITFHSARNLAFRKEIWTHIGGFPEWLDYCEDAFFNIELKKRGYNFHYSPMAEVYYRPHMNIQRFFMQYYLYARGDGKANLLWHRHLVRYAAYGLLIVGLGLWARVPLFWVILFVMGLAYLRRPFSRLMYYASRWDNALSVSQWIICVILLPVIRLTGDLAKMTGYPVGWFWRLIHRVP